MTRASYDVWGALVVGPLIVVVTIPIVVRLFRDADRWTLGIVIAGLFAKLAAAMLFYWVAFDAYAGGVDSAAVSRGGTPDRQRHPRGVDLDHRRNPAIAGHAVHRGTDRSRVRRLRIEPARRIHAVRLDVVLGRRALRPGSDDRRTRLGRAPVRGVGDAPSEHRAVVVDPRQGGTDDALPRPDELRGRSNRSRAVGRLVDTDHRRRSRPGSHHPSALRCDVESGRWCSPSSRRSWRAASTPAP